MTGDIEDIDAGRDNVRKSGPWTVPPRVRVSTSTGNIRLDFREATLTAPVTDLQISSGTGAIDLILPSGATADLSGLSTGTGAVHEKVPAVPAAGPHFVVHGGAGTGSVRVAYSLRFLGLF